MNIISARVSPPQTPNPSRSNSFGNLLSSVNESRRNSRGTLLNEKSEGETGDTQEAQKDGDGTYEEAVHEETPLIEKPESQYVSLEPSGWNIIPRLSRTLLDSIRWVLSTLAAPGVYLIAFLYDERGNFAPFSQIRKLGDPRSTPVHEALEASTDDDNVLTHHGNGKGATGRRQSVKSPQPGASAASSSAILSESESEPDGTVGEAESTPSGSNRQTRSKSQQSSDDNTPTRRSIRIKLNNDDSLRQRKQRKSQPPITQSNGAGAISATEISPAALKSPTSPTASSLSLTKYPRAPAPPRPLIPRRQPSYALPDAPNGRLTQKTLILDLDETLIHSMAKGGRMSTGHMVEVKLNTLVAAGGNTSLGPQHPILYYVHKRPHCDDFLRRVSYLPAPRLTLAHSF